MPFTRRTFAQLLADAEADWDTRLPGADSRLRVNFFHVLSFVVARMAHYLLGYMQNAFENFFAGFGIPRWLSLYGLEQNPATFATGMVDMTGADGTFVPIQTVFVRSDGLEYETTASGTVASGTLTLPVEARTAGSTGNTSAGTAVTVAAAVQGLDPGATVEAAGIGGGVDAETPEGALQRLRERLRLPPHGGNANDYVTWAKQVAGVTRVWVFPLDSGPGTVTVLFVRDNDAGSIFPDAAEIAEVQGVIDGERPVTAVVTVGAPTEVQDAIEIQLVPNTPEVQAAVQQEIADMYLRDATPGGTIFLSRIREAISIAPGETNHVLVNPTSDITHAAQELPTPGTVTFS